MGRSASPLASNIAVSRAGSTPIRSLQAGLQHRHSGAAVAGGYKVAEVYAEFNAPFFKDRPGAELLELDGSVRYSHYKTDTGHTFSHTIFKADVNWKPVDAIRAARVYAQGFRAPTIGELKGGPSRFDSAIDDPCSILSRRRCASTTMPRSMPTAWRRACPPPDRNTAPTDQLSVVTGGNEDLKPETSTSCIFGAVVNPIPRLHRPR